ncbi:MAG: glycosyltransferase [Bryobacteraceae bacterium]|nr:glycosyltransferase [Bryobacteraceae bacterium]
MRILVVSGLSTDSGCTLRARYLTAALRRAGGDARLANGLKALPFWLDWPLSALWNLRLAFTPCDVIIGCKPLPTITPLLVLKKLGGCLTVIDIDDLDFAYRGGFAGRVLRLLQRPFPRHFDIVTYHNEALAPAIQKVFGADGSRFVRLRQGVDFDVFSRECAGEPAKLGAAARWVVYPAHLNIASDLDAIFDVMWLARRALPSIRLLVVGGGPAERRFRKLAKTRGLADITTFTGHVSPEAVARYLKAADAGLAYYKDQPANYFRESMKVREMLAMGVKVVSTDVGDLAQFAALTYQTKAVPEEAADLLVRVLRTGGDGRETSGPAFIRREMDWSKVGREFHRVLNAAVTSRGSHCLKVTIHEQSTRGAQRSSD